VEQVYEELQDSHPEVLERLARGFFYKGTGGDDVMPFSKQRVPTLRRTPEGRIESFFAEKYVDKDRLTDEDKFALRVFVEAAERQDRQLDVNWKSGDALFWNNWGALHGRRAYSDPARHLLRLWIKSDKLDD